ncbi:hypothetical protein A3F62_02045 [Candidatus Woesebacteria bacterium RIFCSPHIGHO2_12_FULL_44_11]|uniref:Ribosomal RNA adenine methylase transferase N-terminal domain-containing protein n=1 Tax=Candidatus Woesebacteria bacterium RIFCSPLOWO2_01_FULL_44_14 TaxID=1802525 RepID=A0A1F8BZS4_9BACT|nr:MAG: hypothetical protein A3F62_02045 [Candidatus Woesebacteria bacterium RIFCSPHIGHO2_12_FULL_44_11]OGM68855.1 MAG: hypothetical protein A2975_00590 [Candidatus Woesebacteria bacterium RIFCSPLOWO2_01_FULL_44_14]
MDIRKLLGKHKIVPDPMKDQFFLEDEGIIQKIVGFADLTRKDIVLEIGAGVGNLTAALAQKARKVVANLPYSLVELFLRQYLYQHENQLIKNSLREGIIKYEKLVHSNKVTKNEARKIISESKIAKKLLERPPDSREVYNAVDKKFT